MAAMLTGSEQNWRSFTRSVLSMMTKYSKQAMVDCREYRRAIWSATGGGSSASGGAAIQAAAAKLRLRPEDLREPAANMSQQGLFTVVICLHEGGNQPDWRGNLYRLMRGYATGGYVGTPGSMADSRSQASGKFGSDNHVVINNDG